VAELAERPDAPGFAMSAREYRSAAMKHNNRLDYGLRAPAADSLSEALGDWKGVCEWVGLKFSRLPTRPNPKMEAAAIAETASAIEADAELRAAWEMRGLPVGRVYTSLKDKRVYCELK
jgi:hypothetical protein